MSASAKKTVTAKVMDNVAPGERSLYYKNVGLFSDPFLEALPKSRGDSFLFQNWDTSTFPEFDACYEWMRSTWDELKDILPKLSEDQLREKWIDPILERLGWETQVEEKVQRWGKSQRPDYSLFESRPAWKKAQGCPNRDEGYFKHVTAIGEAKEMGTPLDTAKLNNTNPSFQIIAYLVATGKEWGILTDGRYWRLYSTKSKSSFRAYYEVNIEKFLGDRDDNQFLYFYNFFRKLAFLKEADTNQSFLDVVFESGEHYAREVETKLKERAFELVELIAQGFSSEHSPRSEQELRVVYEHSLYFLFRLLFVLNCEAKGLLNVHRNKDYYPYSLRSLCVRIKEEHEANQSWARIAKSYNHINDLFHLLSSGDERIGLHGFGKEVFSSGTADFYKRNPIYDCHLNKVLLALAFAEFGKKKELRFIDYKRLSADHLGSLFEGLLEYKLTTSDAQKTKVVALVNSSGERKNTGSYYTPEDVVDYIVRETLGPLTEKKSIGELLELRVIDPAMGSGHFLLGAVRFLEHTILTRLNEDGGGYEFEQGVNWAVLHSCIYGIDRNPMAVELAKFSLWMYTANSNCELEPLSDQLKCSDSLFSDWKVLFQRTTFSAFIGNPPYKIEYSSEYKAALTEEFTTFKLPQNIFTCFIEMVARHTKGFIANQRFGFIVPNTFAKGDTYKDFRRLLGSDLSTSVFDLGGRTVFKDANVYTAIVIGARKKGSHPISYAKVPLNAEFDKWNALKLVDLPVESSGGAILAKYSDLPRLGDLCDVKDVGFNYWSKGRGKTRGGSIADRVLYEGKQKDKRDVPYIKGRDFDKFTLRFSDRYLSYDWESRLMPGDTFRFSAQYFDLKERVCYRQTANRLIATMVPRGYGNDKTVHIVIPKHDAVSSRLLLGYLNSSVYTSMYRELVDEQGQAFAQVKTVVVKKLPLPVPNSADTRAIAEKIEDLVDRALKRGTWAELDQKSLDSLTLRILDSFMSRTKKLDRAA